VRAFFQFIVDTKNTSVKLIEFLNCGIGALGCEFISRMFDPLLPTNIEILTLDYNNFGNEGLFQLMTYVKESTSLTYLSLAYCGIDENGITHFDKFLTTTETLEKLVLQGNPLKNSGMNELITILYNNMTIEEINLNNVLFGNDIDVINSLCGLMQNRSNIIIYHMKFNFINDTDFESILKVLKGENAKHIWQFNIDEKISKALYDDYFKVMKAKPKKRPVNKNKKKAGKGKKGGKKGGK
jgi:hypothetical protein